ncbi:MAG: helix-turn-helix transcriptional regulator [bacterium]
MTVGEYLKKLRQQRGYSIRQVVIKSSNTLDKTTISRVEHDQRKLSLKTAYYLAKIYGVTLLDLVEKTVSDKKTIQDVPFNVSGEEQKLVHKFRNLPPALRVSFKNIIYSLTEIGENLNLMETKFPQFLKNEGDEQYIRPAAVKQQMEPVREIE